MYIYNFVGSVKCGYIAEKDTFLLYNVSNGGGKVVKMFELAHGAFFDKRINAISEANKLIFRADRAQEALGRWLAAGASDATLRELSTAEYREWVLRLMAAVKAGA